jgi:hypothetical protein
MAILKNSACIGQFLSNSEVNGGTEGCSGWTGSWVNIKSRQCSNAGGRVLYLISRLGLGLGPGHTVLTKLYCASAGRRSQIIRRSEDWGACSPPSSARLTCACSAAVQCSAAQRGACECDRSCTRLSGGPWRGRSLTEEAIRPGKERRETGWIVFGPAVA